MARRETDSRYLDRKNKKNTWQNVTGFVTKVHEHDGEETNFSNHEVNVQLASRAEELKKVPVYTDHNGSINVPQKGDAVQISFLKSQTQRPYVSNVIYTDEVRAPLARSGHFRRRFGDESGDDLYFEAEKSDHTAGDPDVVRFAKKEDGLSDPKLAIEIDDNASPTTASIRKNSDPSSDQNDELEVAVEGQTATIKGDPNDDDSQKLVAGVDNGNQKAFLEVTTTGGDVIEMKINQSDGTIDILTKGQDVRIGDKDGTFKDVARRGDSVEVSGVASGSSTETGEITGGSSNVKST